LAWNATTVFWTGDVNRTSQHIQTWFQLALMVFILWDLLDTRKALLSGLQMYVLGGYVVFANAVGNFALGKTYYFERFSAEGTNPDDLGLVLALGIPIAWYLVGSVELSPRTLWLKWINFAYVPVALLGIALSGTRTALIAALPGLVFALVSAVRLSIWAKSAIVALGVSAAYLLIPLVPEASFQRLGTTGTEVFQGDWNGRIELWAQGLAAFREHPLFGIGSNMYRSINFEGKVAHNSFLSVLVELGIVGFVLFAVILGIVFIRAIHQPRWEAAFWLSVLATWALGAFTLTWEYRKPTWVILSFVIASSAVVVPVREHARAVLASRQRRVERLPARTGIT
jgi:O-antigen ligase